MKTNLLSIFLITLTACFTLPALANEPIHETFDHAAAGSITNLPNWLNIYTAPTISTAQPYSSPHALELRPVTNLMTGAVATNFLALYPAILPTEHPVIRVAAKLFLPHTNVNLQFGLSDTQSQNPFYFVVTNGLAKLHARDTGVILPTGVYVNITLHLNRANTQARLDINNTNHINWSDYTSGVNGARFDQFYIFRVPHSGQDQQSVFVDDIRVDTFPPHVWAWWRLDDAMTPFADHLGSFHSPTQPIFGTLVAPHNHPYHPLHDGVDDLANEAVIQRPISSDLVCALAPPALTNWTLECIFQHDPTEFANTFFTWGTDLGFNSDKPFISFACHSIYQLNADLRDGHQTTTASEWLPYLAPYAPDARWHHAALVKAATNLYTYFDYQLIHVTDLSSVSTGDYAFATGSVARIGQALNSGNSSEPQTRYDQVRFSRAALTPRQFLQPVRPFLLPPTQSALAAQWPLTFKTIQGRNYQIETTTALTNLIWTAHSHFAATNPLSPIAVPTTPNPHYIRVQPRP